MKIKSICKALGIITLVLGIIGTIVLAIKFGTTEKLVATYDTVSSKTKFDIGTFLIILLGGLLSTAITSSILFGLSKILESMESLEYKINNIKQDIANEKTSLVSEKNSVVSTSGWECPNCGTLNPSYVSTCRCGKGRKA